MTKNLGFLFLLAIAITRIPSIHSLYSEEDQVIVLTEDSFKTEVLGSSDMWIVEFYAPWCGHCKKLVPVYTEAAGVLKGFVKLGAIDGTQNKELMTRYGIKGYPTLKLFGADKNNPETYQSARKVDAIVKTAMDEVSKMVESRLKSSEGEDSASGKEGGKTLEKDKEKPQAKDESVNEPTDVVELTDANFDGTVLESNEPWLVEFFAPWCGHCKKLAPEWAKAATELKGKVNVGALDATVHKTKAKEYEVKGYPTIKFVYKREVEDYKSGRTSEAIVKYALDKLNKPADSNQHVPEEL